MIASYDPKRGVRLVRNPRFHEWSAAAQPSGYPDEIDCEVRPLAEDAGARRRAGDGRPCADVRACPHRSPVRARGRSTRASCTSIRSRDRTGSSSTRECHRSTTSGCGERSTSRSTGTGWSSSRRPRLCAADAARCYRRTSPATGATAPTRSSRAPTGTYTGPDLAKARRLVAASGTKGQAVTVWASPKPFTPRGLRYIVSVLKSLGYKARLNVTSRTPRRTSGRRRLAAEDPGGRQWLDRGLRLRRRTSSPRSSPAAPSTPGTSDNQNSAEFCDPTIDAEIARARSLQTSDPQAASELWSKIDRDVVDQAPWVVLAQPAAFDFVSRRVGNYQYNPQWGALLDQLWVK